MSRHRFEVTVEVDDAVMARRKADPWWDQNSQFLDIDPAKWDWTQLAGAVDEFGVAEITGYWKESTE